MKSYFSNGVTIIDTKGVTGLRQSNTGHLGVSFDQRRKKYAATIYLKRKHYALGYYTNIEDAVTIRKEAEMHRADGTFHAWHTTLKAEKNTKDVRLNEHHY